ncbi:hypothetical protein MsAc7_10580 [Methanolapillus millepedarum]|uniref:GLUG domain-containing protein n=2 Tax=Methanolapillus millepedarum TaxID=3028296 RepID=A0AA96ZVJ3_9EURY|nr:hypothetical protein MsAc7_10580 [Methanosarcinaceae archaeon Ac7]
MIMIVIVVLLTAMMAGCLNQDADTESAGSGLSSPSGNEGTNNSTNETTNDTNTSTSSSNASSSSSSSLPVIVANSSTGGGGSVTPWLATVSNPFIGTWVSDPDENGMTLVFKGHSDGTFDYEIRNMPPGMSDAFGIPEDGLGDGAYLVRKDLDGTSVVVSYYDFGMVSPGKFVVINDNLIQLTEFETTESGGKSYGESTNLHREGPLVRSDYVNTTLSDSIFIMGSAEIGWGLDLTEEIPEDMPEDEREFMEFMLGTWGKDYFPSLLQFNPDSTVFCTFIDMGWLMEDFGFMENAPRDITFPFSYAFYNDEDDGNDRLIIYTEEGAGENGLLVLACDYSTMGNNYLTYTYCDIQDGFAAPSTETLVSWMYPYVNPKVIDEDNNEAGVMFLTMPDLEIYADQINLAEENGFVWAHEVSVAENSSSENVIGKPNQLASGVYPSGFKFCIETAIEDDDPLRPAIGFGNLFLFTSDNIGPAYGELEEIMDDAIENGEDVGGWVLMDSGTLTSRGIHVYMTNAAMDEPKEITDRISFGMTSLDTNEDSINDSILFSYGAIMVDDALGREGLELNIALEEELVWDDGEKDGNITGELWIALDSIAAAGDGTLSDPYQIETAEQLNQVRYNLDKHFILIDDIDLSEYTNWRPIGTFAPLSDAPEDAETPNMAWAFTGTFDGNGHTISNLTINQPAGFAVGLFGCVVGTDGEDASLYNLTVEDADVTGAVLVGSVVGFAFDCTLEDISLTGDNTISGHNMAGGIVGGSVGHGFGKIIGCNAEADIVVLNISFLYDPKPDGMGLVSGTAGVLGGGLEGFSLADCTAVGTVTATGDDCYGLGGLAGCVFVGPSIENCTADVTITATGSGNDLIGGLLGFSGTPDEDNPTLISDCRVEAVVDVPADAYRVGGLIGGGFYFDDPYYTALYPVPTVFEITNCDTTGSISGGTTVGSIVGLNYLNSLSGCTSGMTWDGDALELIGDTFTI